jgi:hypothetical protein
MAVKVAIAPFCPSCRAMVTLGIRPGLADYSSEERHLIRTADRIFFPTRRFVSVLEAASRPTFPSPQCYRYRTSRVFQTLLFQELNWPHPRTRLYFGSRHKRRILSDFRMPFRASGPLTNPNTTYRIETQTQLERIAETLNPLVIQELIPWEERIRIVSVHHACLAALRIGSEQPTDFPIEPVSFRYSRLAQLLPMNRRLTQSFGLDDIAIEWGYHRGMWHFIEMSRPPLHIRAYDHSINRHGYICNLIDRGIL